MTSLIRRFIDGQVALCRYIDRRLFGAFSVDGNAAFARLLPSMIPPEASIADIGGGKTPFFSADEVRSRRLRVAGVDIDAAELASAEAGAYEEMFVGAIEQVRGNADRDFVIAQSVLEHVYDGRRAAAGMASFLRPGGTIVTFCPCRRAWFARLNLVLPERLKRAILFYVYPAKRERQGYPAHYDGCTPQELERNLRDAGVRVTGFRYFFTSSYFMFFAPLYLFWRMATWPLMRLWPHRYCETFICIGEKV